MRAKKSLITRVILSAATVGSIATGITVPIVTATASSAPVAVNMTSNMIGHIG
jgi:hypothetical protein